jgi:hypothetical protein
MISKTSFLAGCQCPKLIWKKFNEPEAFPPVDEAKQAVFDQGHRIGALAKLLYPGGIEVGEGIVRGSEVIKETQELLSRRVPLYEPAFAIDGGYARVDILVPVGGDDGNAWRIVEVKSGTQVKDENVMDVAFQLHVCRGVGLDITACALMHVDSSYVRQGEIDPSQLLIEEDITERAEDLQSEIPGKLSELHRRITEPTAPEVSIGPHCSKPYSCDLISQCWAFLPQYPVTDLASDNGGKRWQLLDAGIHALADIPNPALFGAKHQIQIQTARTGDAHISPTEIRRFLRDLEWPLAYFDIETTTSAIPLYDGTSPYQQIPFQFSLHVQESKGAALIHHEFLAEGHDDPRPAFLEKLRVCLPNKGTIIAYNASFEKSRLREAASAFPEHSWVGELDDRFLDLLIPFRNFWYHHPDQQGSASIKKVLPVLTGTDYSHLAIQDGNSAARAFAVAEFGDLEPDIRRQMRKDLLSYCQLDTQAMADLMEALWNL